MRFSRRLERLPPYVFARLNELKLNLRRQGRDIVDLGMGNPDRPTPPHIVEKLCQVVGKDPKSHRYSRSRGLPALLRAVARHYKRKFGVDLDPDREVITVIGSKEGIAHLMLALLDSGDLALVPNPTYPIHIYGVVIAGGNILSIPLREERDFVPDIAEIAREVWPPPKVLILNFPHNPTTATVELDFFRDVVDFAQRAGVVVVHDMAYADITFDGYRAPSLLQVEKAKEVGVEFLTMSKSYNMAGWRIGFCVGSSEVIDALARVKSYLDYGIFTPIQVAAIAALDGPQDCVRENSFVYQRRRDVLVEGLNRIGWEVKPPKASMFMWAPIPEPYREMGSVEFSRMLLEKADVAVAPGVGFGEHGEGYVRIALVENEQRLRQAIRNIKRALF